MLVTLTGRTSTKEMQRSIIRIIWYIHIVQDSTFFILHNVDVRHMILGSYDTSTLCRMKNVRILIQILTE